MARLNPMKKREVGTEKVFLGKIILFCEGMTEYNYFDYFAQIINCNRNKYSHITIEFVNADGNAQRVLNCANEFLEVDNNAAKYHTYEKYLVFDCDAPDHIQAVINDMQASEYEYKLLLTNLLFETWLLMHFENLDVVLTKRNTYKKLKEALGISIWGSKEKANPGYIRQIIHNGDSVKNAIEIPKELERKYSEAGYDINKDIIRMNPYTTVHTLVEKILLEI